jgi:hypothetical protein
MEDPGRLDVDKFPKTLSRRGEPVTGWQGDANQAAPSWDDDRAYALPHHRRANALKRG